MYSYTHTHKHKPKEHMGIVNPLHSLTDIVTLRKYAIGKTIVTVGLFD